MFTPTNNITSAQATADHISHDGLLDPEFDDVDPDDLDRVFLIVVKLNQ